MMICEACRKLTTRTDLCEYCRSDSLRKAWGDELSSNRKKRHLSVPLLILMALLAILTINIYLNRSGDITEIVSEPFANTTNNEKQNEEYLEWEKGRTALDQANAIDTVEVYQSFLDNNPGNVWEKNFIYYRDRAELRKAQEIGTREAFQEFIDRRPQSAWIKKALYYQEEVSEKSESGLDR